LVEKLTPPGPTPISNLCALAGVEPNIAAPARAAAATVIFKSFLI